MIEVNRRGVLGQEGKPDVVGRGDGPPQWMPVDVADAEVFVEAPLPGGGAVIVGGHVVALIRCPSRAGLKIRRYQYKVPEGTKFCRVRMPSPFRDFNLPAPDL